MSKSKYFPGVIRSNVGFGKLVCRRNSNCWATWSLVDMLMTTGWNIGPDMTTSHVTCAHRGWQS
jgi:hypothetical protein